jgi:heme-degrading monooxygenase HmoA
MAEDTSLPAEITDGLDPQSTWLSVLQFFVKESEAEAFEKDMEENFEVAKKQPGFISGHYGRSMVDGRYLVISEWDSRANMKAFEDEPSHKEVMDRNEPRYEPGRDMQNRKFVPWYKPGAERKPWTR